MHSGPGHSGRWWGGGAPGQQGAGEGGERLQEEWGPCEEKVRGGRQKPETWRPAVFTNVLGIFIYLLPHKYHKLDGLKVCPKV